ncbi:MAG: GNAT family N-acetyltransferase [Solirubrobacterales bacterium]
MPGHGLGSLRAALLGRGPDGDPKHRSQGVGKALLDAAKHWARQRAPPIWGRSEPGPPEPRRPTSKGCYDISR